MPQLILISNPDYVKILSKTKTFNQVLRMKYCSNGHFQKKICYSNIVIIHRVRLKITRQDIIVSKLKRACKIYSIYRYMIYIIYASCILLFYNTIGF